MFFSVVCGRGGLPSCEDLIEKVSNDYYVYMFLVIFCCCIFIYDRKIYQGNSTEGIYISIELFTPGNRIEFVLHNHMQQVSNYAVFFCEKSKEFY